MATAPSSPRTVGPASPVSAPPRRQQGEDGRGTAQRERVGQAPFPQVDEDERHEEGGGDRVDGELTVAPGGVGQPDEQDGGDGEHGVAPLACADRPGEGGSGVGEGRGAGHVDPDGRARRR